MRALHVQIREQQRLSTNLATKRTLDAAAGEIAQAWNTTEERLAGCSRRIGYLTFFLASAGWDLEGWTD